MHVDESIVVQYVGRYYVGNAFLFDTVNIIQDKSDPWGSFPE